MYARPLYSKHYEMAENKKSFVAYSDWYGIFKALPDEVAGKLIKHIFSYVNDENPTSEDYVINALFEPIKNALKRDLVKWENEREQRSNAGKRSAELRAQRTSTETNERSTETNETQQNSTDSVIVNDNVNDSESVINKKAAPPNVFLNTLNLIELSNLLLENQEHSELFAMLYPYLDFKATIEQFYTHKVKGGVLTDSYNNFTRHFFNWLKVK